VLHPNSRYQFLYSPRRQDTMQEKYKLTKSSIDTCITNKAHNYQYSNTLSGRIHRERRWGRCPPAAFIVRSRAPSAEYAKFLVRMAKLLLSLTNATLPQSPHAFCLFCYMLQISWKIQQ